MTDDPGAVESFLEEVGLDDREVAAAREHGHLELLALEHLVIEEPMLYDLADVSEQTGLLPEQITQLWRSLGFVEPEPHDRSFTAVDIEIQATVARMLETRLIDDALMSQMSRVIGSSVARVAAALVDAVDGVDVGAPPAPDGARDRDGDGDAPTVSSDDFAELAPLLVPTMAKIVEYVWRRHLQAEVRHRMALDHAGADPAHRVVGFADLVGFTALSQQLSTHDLAAVVDRFEAIAYDTVAAAGGRVVKMIGDEVMFSMGDEAEAVDLALRLAETFGADDELSDVRVGLAAGPVLQRDADLYGPVVNRASRIVSLAYPGTVVCDEVVATALADVEEVVVHAIRPHTLKHIGKVPLFVVRRSTTPSDSATSRQEAHARRAARREARAAEAAAKRERRRLAKLGLDERAGDLDTAALDAAWAHTAEVEVVQVDDGTDRSDR